MISKVCECHNEPMFWHKDKNRINGGYWRCRVKVKQATVRYKQTKKGKISERRYRKSEKGKNRDKRYLDKKNLDPAYRLKENMRKTLYRSKRQIEIATRRAESLYG